MLDFMRRKAKSPWVYGAVAAIIVVFIFWGFFNIREGRELNLVKVYGQNITTTEARKYYQNLRERYQAIYRDKFNEELIKKLNLKEKAVNDLIHQVLLVKESRRLGLSVTEEELLSSIAQYPAFQRNGVFDPTVYLRVLQRAHITPKDFEASQRQGLLISKVQSLIGSSVKVSDREAMDYYKSIFEKVNLDILTVNPEDVQGISLTPDEVKQYFSKHREEFKIPARVQIGYLLFNPNDYAKGVQVSSKEVDDYYQKNKDKFGQPKRVRLRHILIPFNSKDPEAAGTARKKAESIREEALHGKDFGELAKKYSEDSGSKDRGGDLGFISRGQVIPQIEEEAFSLKAGAISKVIETRFGFHILKADEWQEARVDPLEKVADQIQTLLRNRRARELALDEADQAYTVSSKEKRLDGFAKEKNLVLQKTGFFSMEDKNDLDPKLKDAAFSLGKGEISPVLRLGENYAVVQVLEKQEFRIPKLPEVEDQVSKALIKEKQKEKAGVRAKAILEKLKQGADLKSLAAREGLAVEETGYFERGAEPPRMSYSEELRKAVATLGPKSPYAANPIFLNGKYYILRLQGKQEIDPKQFESQKENYRLSLLQQKREVLLTQFLESLLDQAKAKGKFQMLQEVNEVI